MTAKIALKRISALLFALVVAVAMMGFSAQTALAEDAPIKDTIGDFEFVFFDLDSDYPSVFCAGYTGSSDTVKLPSQVTYNGKTYDVIAAGTGEGLRMTGIDGIKKLIIPDTYEYIDEHAFVGAESLEEAVIGKGMAFVAGNAFADCSKLKTYRFGYAGSDGSYSFGKIGQTSGGVIIEGVKAYVIKDSTVDFNLTNLNQSSAASGGNVIEIIYSEDPTEGMTDPEAADPGNGNGNDNGNGTDPAPAPVVDKTKQKGTDGTYYGAGASKEAVDKALTALKSEKDQKGMVYSGVKLKMKKVAKTSITLGWSKPSGTAKFVVYGNKCGKSTKYVKLKELTGTSLKLTKVNGAKVKKGTFYKFVVVALNKNGNVVSTSKTVHIATTGGKVTNHKALTVKTKVKKKYKKISKLSVKKGKTKALKVTGVKASKKLACKKHVPIRYESANKKIATVSSKGVIKGVKKGKCKVYAFAQSGVCKAITVTVK